MKHLIFSGTGRFFFFICLVVPPQKTIALCQVLSLVWGATGLDYNYPLVFLEKEGRKGICSKAYLYQVLEPIVFPFWDTLSDEGNLWWRYMKDDSGVHKGLSSLPKLEGMIRGFDWPPSSPDLNPI